MHFATKTSGSNGRGGLNFKWSLQRNFNVQTDVRDKVRGSDELVL